MTDTKVEQAIQSSIALSEGAGTDNGTGIGGLSSALRGFMAIGDHLPPYWSRERDARMRIFWKDGAYLSGIMGAAVSKLANIPLIVVARDPTITAHVNQAVEMTARFNQASEFGEGLFATISKVAEDFLGQDNGGFMEVIGGGALDDKIVGPVVSVRHMDSALCTRTGDHEFPVSVVENGKSYKLHRTRVVYSSIGRNAQANMNGVGYCCVSKSVEVAHSLITMLNYRNEKMGSRPKSMMLVGSGITAETLLGAFAVADEIMNSLGLAHYAQIVAVGGGKDMKVDRVDLNSFEPFDEETQLTLGMHYLALAWGLEPQEIFPVRGGSMASEQVSLQRSRGKLPATYKRDMVKQMEYKMLPAHLMLVADYVDSIEDHQNAVVADIRARTSHRDLTSGATTKLAERQRMLEHGSITREQYITMNLEAGLLEDGSPIAQLFYRQDYADLLVLNRKILVPQANVGAEDEARLNIQANEQLVFNELATASGAKRTRAINANAALVWLSTLYAIPEDEPEPSSVNLEDGGLIDGQTKTHRLGGAYE